MKRIVVVTCVLMRIATSAFCADIPDWVKNAERNYPETQYIRAIGEGTSEKLARTDAIAAISLFFDTRTDVTLRALKELGEFSQGATSYAVDNESYRQIAHISSEAEFFCVQFTDPYRDKKTGQYAVLAYINKKEAAQIYTARINALMESVNAYRAYAQQEKEPFLAVDALRKAQKLGSLAETYIHTETIIVPSDSVTFAPYLKTIALIPNEQTALKKELTFSITMLQKEKRYDPLFSTVASILEKHGYAYSVANANYTIIVDVSCIEERYDTGNFIRPSVDVLIVNAAGDSVYTYAKALSRTSGKTTDQAYTRVVTKIKQDLEDHFLAE